MVEILELTVVYRNINTSELRDKDRMPTLYTVSQMNTNVHNYMGLYPNRHAFSTYMANEIWRIKKRLKAQWGFFLPWYIMMRNFFGHRVWVLLILLYNFIWLMWITRLLFLWWYMYLVNLYGTTWSCHFFGFCWLAS